MHRSYILLNICIIRFFIYLLTFLTINKYSAIKWKRIFFTLFTYFYFLFIKSLMVIYEYRFCLQVLPSVVNSKKNLIIQTWFSIFKYFISTSLTPLKKISNLHFPIIFIYLFFFVKVYFCMCSWIFFYFLSKKVMCENYLTKMVFVKKNIVIEIIYIYIIKKKGYKNYNIA